MRIKEAIKEKGLTVAEVAAKMGVKGPALSQVINGNPTVEMLERIAAVLEVDIRELFGDTSGDVYGTVQYKGLSFKIDSLASIKRVLSHIESEKVTTE